MKRWIAAIPVTALVLFAGLAGWELSHPEKGDFERISRTAPDRAFERLEGGTLRFAPTPNGRTIAGAGLWGVVQGHAGQRAEVPGRTWQSVCRYRSGSVWSGRSGFRPDRCAGNLCHLSRWRDSGAYRRAAGRGGGKTGGPELFSRPAPLQQQRLSSVQPF